MGVEAKRRSKSQNLSLRLDPKTRFLLDFVARVKGQSITTVVERAIKDAAHDTQIGAGPNGEGGRNWADYWHIVEGVRTLRLLADDAYPASYDEEEIKTFTMAHWPFFYKEKEGESIRKIYITILWPNIYKYLIHWNDTRATDFWAAGNLMVADLVAARVGPPEWPPKGYPESPPSDENAADDV